jgi:hypothetical protein
MLGARSRRVVWVPLPLCLAGRVGINSGVELHQKGSGDITREDINHPNRLAVAPFELTTESRCPTPGLPA